MNWIWLLVRSMIVIIVSLATCIYLLVEQYDLVWLKFSACIGVFVFVLVELILWTCLPRAQVQQRAQDRLDQLAEDDTTQVLNASRIQGRQGARTGLMGRLSSTVRRHLSFSDSPSQSNQEIDELRARMLSMQQDVEVLRRNNVTNQSSNNQSTSAQSFSSESRTKTSVPKPNKYELLVDFEMWWPQFASYAECQKVDSESLKQVLLSFMSEKAGAVARRAIKGTIYSSYETLYEDLRTCFAPSDVPAQQLVAKLAVRNQFADESLQSYSNDVWDWVERIDRVQPYDADLDQIVMKRFVDGLHNCQVLAKLKGLVKARMFENRLPSARDVLAWAKEFSDDSGANRNGQYFQTYTTCAEYKRPSTPLERRREIGVNSVLANEYKKFMGDDAKNVTFSSPGNAYYQQDDYESDMYCMSGQTSGGSAQVNATQLQPSSITNNFSANKSYSGSNPRYGVRNCYQCGKPGHLKSHCPEKQQFSESKNVTFSSQQQQYQHLPLQQQLAQPQKQQQLTQHQQAQHTVVTSKVVEALVNSTSAVLSAESTVTVGEQVYRPFARKLIQIDAQIKVNGQTVDAVMDTGSPVTLMRESCWRCIKRSDELAKVPFDVKGCSDGSYMNVLGMCNLPFEFYTKQAGVVTVIVVSDNSSSNNLLLGLNAIEEWPAMKHIVDLMCKQRGVSAKEIGSGFRALDTNESVTNSINVSIADSVVKPFITVRTSSICVRPQEAEVIDESSFLAEYVIDETNGLLAIEMFNESMDVCVNGVQLENGEQNINEFYNEIAAAVLAKFPNITAEPNTVLGQALGFEHCITLAEGARAIRVPLRTVPHALKAEFKCNLDKLFARGIIVKSRSPYGWAIVIVRKADGTLRICVDFRLLNTMTIKDAFPLPRIDELVARLGQCTRFSTLDLADGYYQIPLKPEDRHKTAFVTEYGLFEFTVMPFGLCNAPASFQRMMEFVLEKHICSGIANVYIDDTVVGSKKQEDHKDEVLAVCADIANVPLYVKWRKCAFDLVEIEYLGYLLGRGRIIPSPKAAAVIRDCPRPVTVRDVQHFLGLAGHFRKHVRNFSKIAAPLHEAVKGNGSSKKTNGRDAMWNEECQHAFEALKLALSTLKSEDAGSDGDVQGCLALPNFEHPFVFTSDACDIGLGAYISQKLKKIERPIAFWSRKLHGAELDYATGEKELMAIVLGIEYFKQYLYGRRFMVCTDHRPLSWLRDHATPSCRLARWLIKVRQFDFEIRFISGVDNVVADALSRFFLFDERAGRERVPDPGIIVNSVSVWPSVLALPELNEAQAKDTDIAKLAEWIRERERPDELASDASRDLRKYFHVYNECKRIRNAVYRESIDKNGMSVFQFIVPTSDRVALLETMHNHVLAGHLSGVSVGKKIAVRYWWPGVSKDVKNHCRECDNCAKSKTATHNRPPMIPIKVTAPFEMVTYDIMGPISPASPRGNKYVLVIVDHFTKWVEIYAMIDQKAPTIANIMYQEYITRHGVPLSILSDQGRAFCSEVLTALWSLLDVDQRRTTPYHPQCDGLTERFNRTLGAMIRAVTLEEPNRWDELLKPLSFAYNTAVHKTTGVQPFVMLYGRLPRLPADLIFKPDDLEVATSSLPDDLVDNDYAKRVQRDLHAVYALVRAHRDFAVERQKFFHDRRVRCDEYKLEDRVYCRKDEKPRKGNSKKLTARYSGPYEVVGKTSIPDGTTDVVINYKIKPDGAGKSKFVNVSKLKKCYMPKMQVTVAPKRRSTQPRSQAALEAKQRSVLSTSTQGDLTNRQPEVNEIFQPLANVHNQSAACERDQTGELEEEANETTQRLRSVLRALVESDDGEDDRDEDEVASDDEPRGAEYPPFIWIDDIDDGESDEFDEHQLGSGPVDLSQLEFDDEDIAVSWAEGDEGEPSDLSVYMPNYYYQQQLAAEATAEPEIRSRRQVKPIERLGIA